MVLSYCLLPSIPPVISPMFRLGGALTVFFSLLHARSPYPISRYVTALPNGWRITPIGRVIQTEDLIPNLTPSEGWTCCRRLA